MAVEVLMPRLTDTMHKGLVTYWYKSEEENTQEGEPLFVVETDKATVEVNACATGVLLKILVTEGQAAEVGERVAIIGENGEDFQALMSGPPKFVAEQKEADLLEAPEERATRLMASPAAKRRARHNRFLSTRNKPRYLPPPVQCISAAVQVNLSAYRLEKSSFRIVWLISSTCR